MLSAPTLQKNKAKVAFKAELNLLLRTIAIETGPIFFLELNVNILGMYVFKVKEHYSDLHFAIGGDQGAVHGPGVPVLGHRTINFVNTSSESVDSIKSLKK